MIEWEIGLTWTVAGLYLLVAVICWIALLWQREGPVTWGMWILTAGLVIHAVPQIMRWVRIGHGPYINAFEVLSLSVWTGLAALVLLSLRFRSLRLGAGPVLTIGVLMLGWGVLSDPEAVPAPPTFRSIWLVFHVVGAKLAFGAILLATGLSVAHMILSRRLGKAEDHDKELKTKLTRLDNLSYRLVAFGLVFIGFMTASGAIWAHDAWGSYWSWDPLETWSLITWLAYGLSLHLRLTFKVRGRNWALVVLALLVLSIFSFFVTALVTSTVHTEFMEGT